MTRETFAPATERYEVQDADGRDVGAAVFDQPVSRVENRMQAARPVGIGGREWAHERASDLERPLSGLWVAVCPHESEAAIVSSELRGIATEIECGCGDDERDDQGPGGR